MKGDPRIIEILNQALKAELTAINQYFLHSRMYEDWGLMKLSKMEYEESIDEMKHADRIIKRVLFLSGLPNLQDLDHLLIGENPVECLQNDLKLEYEALDMYKAAVKECESVGDYATRDLFEDLIRDEEGHADFLETQLELIDRIGEQRYLQSQMGEQEAGG
ncbi:bacterioferritin [Wenzhouxiangella sp. EGI_FJ10409]|uniref:bacterioferritin n=1 Tax=Wenzhouxiangella sp. EGI_FJ10409 TaxID=3243767 RepID=UPI0035DE49B0